MSKVSENKRLAVLATELGLALAQILTEYGWSQEETNQAIDDWLQRAEENRAARAEGRPIREAIFRSR